MAIVGCYSLDLYCDIGCEAYGFNCPHRNLFGAQGEHTGPNERDCLKQARKDGWTFDRSFTTGILELAYCPKCSKERK